MALFLSAAESDNVRLHQQQQSAHVARTRQAAEWISTRQDGIDTHAHTHTHHGPMMIARRILCCNDLH